MQYYANQAELDEAQPPQNNAGAGDVHEQEERWMQTQLANQRKWKKSIRLDGPAHI